MKKDITNKLWKYKARCEECGADILEKCWNCKDSYWFMIKVPIQTTTFGQTKFKNEST